MLDYKIFEMLNKGLEEEVQKVLAGKTTEDVVGVVDDIAQKFQTGSILIGKILRVIRDDVVVDVGYKSEGRISLSEFDGNVPEVGSDVEVLLDALEDETGLIVLSKKKADRIRGWERIITHYKEGDNITGTVSRKIRGGLLVDVGVPVFLPASQVDIRRIPDIGVFLNQEIECKIIKIDESRRNIVVSRRKLIEDERHSQKTELFTRISVGDVVAGVVKNIADFGAFVDIGGIDGLLHITDMSWGRINHPSEMLKIDQEIDVKILKIDNELERVALGLKQKSESPWDSFEERFPIGSKIVGKVVNVTSYGAFVEIEEGVEGLVHVSQMSWDKRIAHPTDVVNVGDEIETVIMAVDLEKKEISLGMKQASGDPWEEIESKYSPGTIVNGIVRNLTSYGAFVELDPGVDGLLHVKDLSWTKKVNAPGEVLEKDQEIEVKVLYIDQERHRVALGLKQMEEDPWENKIPEKYPLGSVANAMITKLTNFGAFAELEDGLEGLLHVSEMSEDMVSNPSDVLKEGETVEVTVIKMDRQDRRISLSMR
jgi:small subunit ribosomal protein S1